MCQWLCFSQARTHARTHIQDPLGSCKSVAKLGTHTTCYITHTHTTTASTHTHSSHRGLYSIHYISHKLTRTHTHTHTHTLAHTRPLMRAYTLLVSRTRMHKLNFPLRHAHEPP